ncbi:hypothetical protein E2562_024093 [Oryza meyeriana var. granulata]|uniref:Uncharacterized protein n=1 Tax=Oryza meyeriana var. granulata TaxID=110450 RepID=A0A6G1CGL8_9ORYZ|nr:hypothetical protein E2562_024093 [Oryza meyeriana var. granulata]
MSQIQSSSQVCCTMLAVLCGKVTGRQRTPPGLVPDAQQPRLSYPFLELISSWRLEVHTLINPTVDQFLEAQRAVQPNLMYLQGQQLENEEEIGSLVHLSGAMLMYLILRYLVHSLVHLFRP